jgi:hypothetical protein
MENLSEKVYECNLAVEAHMMVDLLSQAGISARIDGEFLQSAAGEIPLGNTVKVRVDPSRAAEAREVIADWEKLRPDEPPGPPATKTARLRSPLWFLAGAMVGAAAMLLIFSKPRAHDPGSDRNRDGRADTHWSFDFAGYANLYEEDNDFDGRYEWRFDVENDLITRGVLDRDFDGRPEQITHFVSGVPASTDYFFASGGRVVKRVYYRAGLPDHAEFDDDGDGRFERRVQYDAHGEPKL